MGNEEIQIQTEVSNPYISSSNDTCIEVIVKISSSNSTPTIKTALGSCIVIDKSGSMKGKKLDNVKKAVLNILDQYEDDDIISIITFDFNVQLLVPPTLANQRKKIKKAVKKIKPDGPTSLYTALNKSIELCKKLKNANPRILLFTDGYPTDIKDSEKYSLLIRDAFASGITTSTIGVGQFYNDIILRTVSDNGGGWWEHISDLDKIDDAFNKEFEQSKTIVTRHPFLVLKLNANCGINSIHMIKPIAKLMDASYNEMGTPILYIPDMYQGGVQEYIIRLDIKASNWVGETPIIDVKYADSIRESICTSVANIEFTKDEEIIKHYKPRPKALMELVTIMEQGTQAIELGDKQLALDVEEKTRALLNNPTLINALNADEGGKTKLIFDATQSMGEGKEIDTKVEIARLRQTIY
jgi:uncharacterized protein YegL